MEGTPEEQDAPQLADGTEQPASADEGVLEEGGEQERQELEASTADAESEPAPAPEPAAESGPAEAAAPGAAEAEAEAPAAEPDEQPADGQPAADPSAAEQPSEAVDGDPGAAAVAEAPDAAEEGKPVPEAGAAADETPADVGESMAEPPSEPAAEEAVAGPEATAEVAAAPKEPAAEEAMPADSAAEEGAPGEPAAEEAAPGGAAEEAAPTEPAAEEAAPAEAAAEEQSAAATAAAEEQSAVAAAAADAGPEAGAAAMVETPAELPEAPITQPDDTVEQAAHPAADDSSPESAPEAAGELQGETGPGEVSTDAQPAQTSDGGHDRPASGSRALPPPGDAAVHGSSVARSESQVQLATELPASYDKGAFMQAIDPDVQLPLDAVPTTHILSLDAYKRNNIAYIEDDVLVTSAGNNVIFFSLADMSCKYMQGLDGGGIGAIAVHPSRKFLAVAEKCKCRSPNVYIYTYPELVLNRVLRLGTEQAYSALAFNDAGNTLASVGAYPDYLLTLWNWQDESIILRSKAFSQDVYKVKFSPYFEGLLNTSGTGHIRFWKIAATFTGLKLQGQIGKFGAVELTDVVAFVEMPDGKVLSSTETGELLMWDGGLIKVVLTRTDRRPCHDGAIHVLMHDQQSNCIVTGGADGYVRLWNFTKINEAEAEEDSNHMVISPLDEMLIAPGARIKSLIWERQHWLIQDEAGALYKVTLPDSGLPSKGATVSRLLEFHSGGIAGMHLSPVSHTAVTAGLDGTMRIFDYAGLKTVAVSRFNQPATALTALGASGLILAAGFADGVVRVVRRCSDGMGMLSAVKPHKGRVTSLLLSPDGHMLATTGEDGTVFFFAPDAAVGGLAAGALKPVAFTVVPAVVTCCVWTPDSRALLCGTVAGTVIEVLAPEPDLVDVTKTFEVQGLLQRQYTFKCPKPPKKKKAKKAAEGGEEGATEEGKAEEAGDTAKPADGANGDAAEGEAKAEEAEEQEEEAKEEDLEAPSVLTIRLPPSGIPGQFLLTLDGKAAGTVWLGSLDTPAEEPALAFAPACGATSLVPGLVIPPPAPTTFVEYAGARSELLLLGSADGVVRVQRAAATGATQGPFWEAALHDMQEGRVTAVHVSFDGAYLLSAAKCGTLYVQEMRMEGSPQAQPSGPESLPALEGCVATTPDIVNPKEYTIEEAKQKAEQDALMAAAEKKKMGVREYLQQIRKEFEAMLAENQARPESERLPRTEFEIDPGLREMMEEEAKQKEEAARLELAWETEKRRLALAKLKAFFLDKVEVERIVLYALQSKMFVTTFRTAKLPDNVLEELREAQRQQQEEQEAASRESEATRRSAAGARGDGADGGPLMGATSMTSRKSGIMESAMSGMADSDTSRMTKADLRRLARKKREAEWASFSATKPDDKYENPADVAAIEEAERNMGDFKLKSDPNYVIPEEHRMTPQRKRLQMLLLEEAIYKVKMEFNNKFLALRDVKKKVIAEVNSRLAKLKDINTQLAAREAAAAGYAAAAAAQPIVAGFSSELSLKAEEHPETREVVTEEDLEEFAWKKEEEKKAAQGSALGGFAGSGPAAQPAAKRGAAPGPKVPAAGGKGPGAAGGDHPGAPGQAPAVTADDALAKMMAAVPLSDFEKALQAFHKKRLDHAKAKLQEEVVEMVEAFDEALSSLRREKFKLEADVKMAEMKQLVHYQELVLLRDFDKREVILIQKRQAKLDDRKEIMDKIGECNNKLEQKRIELEGLMARRAAVLADFDALVPESDPFREPLSKIFHRRIKRSKKKASADDDEDAEEEEEEEDGEEGEEDDDDDDEEVCPPGCDHSLYERVCEQREKRLDEDDLITEFQKTIEVVKKEKETAAKKQKLVEQSLAAIQQDITEFQREKQGRLNQIDVVVNLKMHQIEYLVDGRLPVDLTQGLVFSDKELEKLKRRIEELDQEKTDLRAKQKTLKKEHLQLLRDKRAKEAKVSELEAKAYDVQMLKFGQVIDLDLLDRIGASKGTEDLKEQLKAQETQYAKELAEWDKKIAARTDELMALTRENTNCLNAVSELTISQRKLESSLATARTTMFSDPVVQRKQEVEERDQLVQLVNAQATEIQKLKAQINALHRKDTSVYQ